MKKQSFQHGEIRDQDDNIIQAGSYGKKTAFTNGQNTGIIDYIINNFEVLFEGILAAGLIEYDKDGNPVLPIEIKEALQSYVTTAKEEAEEANASANSAVSSASAAQEAANTATTKAKEANASATNAEGFASTAQEAALRSERAASGVQNINEQLDEIKTLATKADTSANNAASSASAALGAANTASTKASDAHASATDAANHAADAATSASNAAGSASTASTKAADAHASATDAANYAADAETSASNAADIADTAQVLIGKAEYGFLKRNIAYKVGDIAYTEQLPAGYYLECVTAGTTGDTEPNISVESESVSDGTVKWGVKNIQDASKSGLPVGFETFTLNPNLQAGWLPLLGGEYSRTAYADLWAWVQTQQGYLIEESAWQAKATANGGNVPFYSKGDGRTTFRVPALKCWVKGANSISEVGGYLAAGLPNIKGEISNNDTSYNSIQMYKPKFAGALTGIKKGNAGWDGSCDGTYNVYFDASLSNPIYGSSDTVQPPSIVGLWAVKAYGTVTNVGSTDVANISTGLTQAETRISALENHGAGATVVESYRNDTEWYRVWSDGWVEQGGSATYKGASGTTITFSHPFSDTNFYMGMSDYEGGSASVYYNHTYIRNKAATNCKIYTGCNESISIQWYACGQGA